MRPYGHMIVSWNIDIEQLNKTLKNFPNFFVRLDKAIEMDHNQAKNMPTSMNSSGELRFSR